MPREKDEACAMHIVVTPEARSEARSHGSISLSFGGMDYRTLPARCGAPERRKEKPPLPRMGATAIIPSDCIS